LKREVWEILTSIRNTKTEDGVVVNDVLLDREPLGILK